jgi:hypothetical protein
LAPLFASGLRHDITAADENTNLLTIAFVYSNPRRLAVGRVDQHYVGCVDITFLLHDTALLGTAAPGLQVVLLHFDTLDPNARLLVIDGEYVALFATVCPCDDLNEIAFSNA